MANEEQFRTWVALGVPLFLFVGVLGAFILHAATNRGWAEILVGVSVYVSVQILFWVAMYWARKWGRPRRDFRAGAIVTGLYGWLSGLLLIHYAAKWGFMDARGIRGDYRDFSIAMAVVTLLVFALFSFYKGPARGPEPL